MLYYEISTVKGCNFESLSDELYLTRIASYLCDEGLERYRIMGGGNGG